MLLRFAMPHAKHVCVLLPYVVPDVRYVCVLLPIVMPLVKHVQLGSTYSEIGHRELTNQLLCSL